MKNPIDWRAYERIIASIVSENSDLELSVTPNARIKGFLSGVNRQVDVLIDARWDTDLSKRIIVEVKHYKRKLHVKDIESFEGMMRDCQANQGIIYAPRGCTSAALNRAQNSIMIKTISLEDIDESWWAKFDYCRGACNKKNETKPGLLLWDSPHLLGIGNAWAIIHTGKCDTCSDFNVWCEECGEKFALHLDQHYTCPCGRLWSCLEGEEDSLTIHYLTMVLGQNILAFDRKILG